jgi:hypothetical protein
MGREVRRNLGEAGSGDGKRGGGGIGRKMGGGCGILGRNGERSGFGNIYGFGDRYGGVGR